MVGSIGLLNLLIRILILIRLIGCVFILQPKQVIVKPLLILLSCSLLLQLVVPHFLESFLHRFVVHLERERATSIRKAGNIVEIDDRGTHDLIVPRLLVYLRFIDKRTAITAKVDVDHPVPPIVVVELGRSDAHTQHLEAHVVAIVV